MQYPQDNLTKICKTCGVEYHKKSTVSKLEWSKSQFCSRACINKGRVSFRKGKPLGYEIWNKGKKGVQDAWNKGMKYDLNERHSLWKGDKASLVAKHSWVKRRLGKPQKCQHCGTTEDRMYHWANISGKYKRDLSDWKRLCVPCHKKYDLDKINNKGYNK